MHVIHHSMNVIFLSSSMYLSLVFSLIEYERLLALVSNRAFLVHSTPAQKKIKMIGAMSIRKKRQLQETQVRSFLVTLLAILFSSLHNPLDIYSPLHHQCSDITYHTF